MLSKLNSIKISKLFNDNFLDSQCACNPYGPRGERAGNYLLVLTSFFFIIPFLIPYKKPHPILFISLFLFLTSVTYHSTHNCYIRALDVFAVILTSVFASITLLMLLVKEEINIYISFSCIFCLISLFILTSPFFYGKYNPNDNNDSNKMIYLIPHAILHFSTAMFITLLYIVLNNGL